jgi:hypothetical protein
VALETHEWRRLRILFEHGIVTERIPIAGGGQNLAASTEEQLVDSVLHHLVIDVDVGARFSKPCGHVEGYFAAKILATELVWLRAFCAVPVMQLPVCSRRTVTSGLAHVEDSAALALRIFEDAGTTVCAVGAKLTSMVEANIDVVRWRGAWSAVITDGEVE